MRAAASAQVLLDIGDLDYVPDLPGCVATGSTVEETEAQIREAIEFHLEGLREDGALIPLPASRVEYVEIAA